MVKFKTGIVYMDDALGNCWKCFDCPVPYQLDAKRAFLRSMDKILKETRRGSKVPIDLGVDSVCTPRDEPIPMHFHPDFPKFIHFEKE